MRYKTKPFEIEAVQFTGYNLNKVREAFPDAEFEKQDDYMTGTPVLLVWDKLQFTWVRVNSNDYVIKGMKGEYYPCEKEVFEAKYEVYDYQSE